MKNRMKAVYIAVASFFLVNTCFSIIAEDVTKYNKVVFRVVDEKESLVVPGNAISGICSSIDQINRDSWDIEVELNNSFSKKFGHFTEQNIGKEIEVISKNSILLKARVIEPIWSGKIRITTSNENEKNKMLEKLVRK